MNFSTYKGWTIPEGNVIKVECNGAVLWSYDIPLSPVSWFTYNTTAITGLSEEGANATEICIPRIQLDSWGYISSIGQGAFKSNKLLTAVIISNGYTQIGMRSQQGKVYDGAFAGCSNLSYVSIPDSVTTIGTKTFENCKNLKGIVIPNSVTCIDYAAFLGCTALTTVYYTGTEEQWNAITFGGDNSVIKNVTKVFNYVP